MSTPEPNVASDTSHAKFLVTISYRKSPVREGTPIDNRVAAQPAFNLTKGIVVSALQLLVTAAGIWFVFHDPLKRAQVVEALRNADRRWLIAGWICYGAVELLATGRWQILLRVQGISLRWWRTGGIVMTGLLFNIFLPGLIGGDAMRLYLVTKCAPERKPQAVVSVAMDRLLGLLSLLFLAGISLGLRFDWLRRSNAALHIVQLTVALLAGALVFVLLLFLTAGLNLLHRLPNQLPCRKGIVEGAEALKLYGRHFIAVIAAFLITLLSHCAYYTCFYCASQSVHASGGATGSFGNILSIMPLVNTITAVPISIGGIGIRETLFQELLGQLSGVSAATAALTASLGFALQVSWGILGAGIYFLVQEFSHGRRRQERRTVGGAQPVRAYTR